MVNKYLVMNEGKDRKQKMKEGREGGKEEKKGWKDGRKEGRKIGGEGRNAELY